MEPGLEGYEATCESFYERNKSAMAAAKAAAVNPDDHAALADEFLSAVEAKTIIFAAVNKSIEMGCKMNIYVVDGGNLTKAFVRMDGAFRGSADIALKKAKTARFFNANTADLTPLCQPGQPLYGIEYSNDGLITFPGGVLIKNLHGTIIGAVGVSGGTVDQDHEVASAGAAAADRIDGDLDDLPHDDPTVDKCVATLDGLLPLPRCALMLVACLQKATEIGVAMNISILDGGAVPKAFMRMDGAFIGSIDVANKKAKTSRLFSGDTDWLTKLTYPGQPLYGIEASNDGLICFPGGVLLKDKEGITIGAVGVSGGTVEEDRLVATAAKQVSVGEGIDADFANKVLAIAPPGSSDLLDGLLPLERAKTVIHQCMTKAAELGVHVNVCVLDTSAHMKAFFRMDGAHIGSADLAYRKARSACLFANDTANFSKLTAPGQPLFGIEASNGGCVFIPGGVLIREKSGLVIGVVGVSGGTAEQDCVIAGAGAALLFDCGADTPEVAAPPPVDVGTVDVLTGPLTIKTACEIAEAAIAKATEIGVPQNVDVVDGGGFMKVFMRMDNAFLGAIDIAMTKAKTARLFNMDTKDISPFTQPGMDFYRVEVSNGGLITFAGGCIIKTAEHGIVGAIGVSGGSVDQDHECAAAGAAVVA